jgi:ferrochelatase
MLRRYLGEFLMDERVIDLQSLANFFGKRNHSEHPPQKSAKAYKKIWWEEGSPLIVLSKRLQEAVQKKVSVPIELAMRYGTPSIEQGIKSLVDQGVDEIMLIPLYPQFAMATTETILVLAEKIKNEKYPELEFTVLPPFYNHPDYIRVLSQSIQEDLKDKKWEHLLFSYHGIPERHIRKSDITKSHCKIDKSCCQTTSEGTPILLSSSVLRNHPPSSGVPRIKGRDLFYQFPVPTWG